MGDVNDRIQRRRGGALGIVTVAVVTAAAVVLLPELAGPLFSDGFEGAKEAPGLPVEPCPEGDPRVTPDGYGRIDKTWAQAFKSPRGVVPTWPNTGGSPVPIGSSKHAYLVVSFTATADTTVDMTWDTAQSQGGYTQPRPAHSMAVVISQCPGDFRVEAGVFNPCARVSGLDSMFWTTRQTGSTSACQLEAGKAYFLNIAPIDPTDGITFGEHTCQDVPNSAAGCDVQMKHNGY